MLAVQKCVFSLTSSYFHTCRLADILTRWSRYKKMEQWDEFRAFTPEPSTVLLCGSFFP